MTGNPRVSSRDVSAVIQVKKIVKNNTKTLQQQEEQQQLWKQPRKRRDSDADSTSSSECTMATAQSIGRVKDVIKRLRRFRLEREERKRFRLRRRQERRERVDIARPEVSTPPDQKKSSPQQQQQVEKQMSSPQRSIEDRRSLITCETDPAIARFLRMHGISDRVGTLLRARSARSFIVSLTHSLTHSYHKKIFRTPIHSQTSTLETQALY